MTFECLNSSLLFVKIKSMHDGFSDWKQKSLVIKDSRLKVLIKVSRFLLSVVKLKLPVSIILSYWQVRSPNFLTGY